MLSILFLVMIFSFDSFLVSIAYSIKKINISFSYIVLISFVSVISLLFSVHVSKTLMLMLPELFLKMIGFLFLFILGLYNILQDKIKNLLSNNKNNKLVRVYLDETNADFDNSKNLGFSESIVLSFILSLDSLIGGISVGLLNINQYFLLIIVFIINIILFLLGNLIGQKLSNLLNVNLSYISGIMIIVIAILKFI